MKKYKVAIVGCGDISGIYLKNILNVFKEIEIVGVCDFIREKAEKAAELVNTVVYNDLNELLAGPADIVLNLTRPYEHYNVSMAAIKAGKHVYSEKPLGASLKEGLELFEEAKKHNVRMGGAPDTFLGAGIQTCRKLIDSGFIGTPVGASAFMVCRGHESWHPNPEFYYKRGGGPMMDMGPYYLTAMISLLGAVDTVTGMAKASFPTRTITSEPKKGTVVDVEAPTYTTGLMKFKSGAIGSIFTTFDVYRAQVPRIEIYGSEGTLSVPDPNTFGGPVMLFRPEKNEFTEIPLMFEYSENSRGLGLMDMAKAIETGCRHRANIDLTLHVLEIMESINQSSEEEKHIKINSFTERPEPMVKNVY